MRAAGWGVARGVQSAGERDVGPLAGAPGDGRRYGFSWAWRVLTSSAVSALS